MANQYDGTIRIGTMVDTSGVEKGAGVIEGKMKNILGAVKKLGGVIASAFAVKALVEFSKACIEVGSDLEEVQNVVDVAFGKMSGAIDNFAKDAAVSFGLSELAAKQYTSTMGAMLKSSGIAQMGLTSEQITKHMSDTMKKNFKATGDAVTDMSIAMTQLSADMASFYNLDNDTAFAKLRAGISGETEPLKQLGINLSAANLEQFRLAQGINTAYNAMSEQEKMLLRYNYILAVTGDAQGDFARTSGSWANQTKILNLQLEQIKANLGQGLINILTPVLKLINTVLGALVKLAAAFKAFTELITGKKSQAVSTGAMIADTYDAGSAAADDFASSQQKAGKATQQAAKQLERYLSPLDEINRIQSDMPSANVGDDSSVSVPSSGGSGAVAVPQMDFGQLEEGETVVDSLAQKMANLFDSIKTGCQPALDALKNLWEGGLSLVIDFSWGALKDFYDNFLKPLATWTMGEGLPRFIDALNNGLLAVDWDNLRTSINGLWQALEPFAENVGEGLLWLWENVLVTLGTWVMNEVVPRFFETLTNILNIFNAVIDALKPLWMWFWETILQPVAEWTGGMFLEIWDRINGALEAFAQWCRDNPETVQTITTLILSFFAAWKIVGLVSGIGSIISAVGSMLPLISTVLNPWVLAIGGVIAAGILLWRNWDKVKQKATEIWEAISTWLIGKWENIKASCWLKFEHMKRKIEDIWTSIQTKAVEIWEAVGTWLSTKWEAIRLASSKAFGKIKAGIFSAWNAVQAKITAVWTAVHTWLTEKWTAISATATEIFEGIKEFFANLWTNIRLTATSGWLLFKGSIIGIWTSLKANAKAIWDSIKKALSDTWTTVRDKAIELWEQIKSTITGKWDDIKTAIENAIPYLQALITACWGGVKLKASLLWNEIKETVTGVWDGLVEAISEKIETLKSNISEAWDAIKENASAVWETIKETVVGFFSTIKEKAVEIFNGVKETVGGAFEDIADVLKTPINAAIAIINAFVRVINDLMAHIESALTFTIDLKNPFGGGQLLYYEVFGPSLPRVAEIPQLASGAVIPPNAPFYAMLGDQKHGQNLELPEELLRRVIREETDSAGGSYRFTAQINRRTLFDEMISEAQMRRQVSGRNPFEMA